MIFQEPTNTLNKALNNPDNVLIAGHVNIDLSACNE